MCVVGPRRAPYQLKMGSGADLMGRTEENDCFDVVTSRPPVFGDVATLTTSLTSCISGTSSSGN